MKEKFKWIIVGVLLLIMVLQSAVFVFNVPLFIKKNSPIKVGVLYSSTGQRAVREIPVKEATLMAIEEINQKGGIQGRKIIPIVRDSQSDWKVTKNEAEKLILEDQVAVVFGEWVPIEHSDILTAFEKHKSLLITPFQYLAIFDSPHIIVAGTMMSQQIPPTINYCFEYLSHRFILVGSNNPYSHVVNRIIKILIKARQGEIVNELYLPLEPTEKDWDKLIDAIVSTPPPVVIIKSLRDSEIQPFFDRLSKRGISQDYSFFSLTLNENALQEINIPLIVNSYYASSYFQSIDTPINHEFVKNFQKFSGISAISNTAEAGYFSVYVWAQAVQETGKLDPISLNYAFNNMQFQAPEGLVIVDINGQYLWKHTRIGRLRENKQYDIVWESSMPIRPFSYPIFFFPKELFWFAKRIDESLQEDQKAEGESE